LYFMVCIAVDPEEVPDYFEVIKEPMDLETMLHKIERGVYQTKEQFRDDILLIKRCFFCLSFVWV
jgi:ATPase family AAA domain-containing protein 2